MELTIKDLSVFYGKRKILDSLNCSFKKGFTCLLGKNGAGKSTLIKAMYSIVKKKGTVCYNSLPINEDFILKKVSYLPQTQMGESSALSVLETVLLGDFSSLGITIKKNLKNRAFKILETFGIENLHNESIRDISGGQKQMVFLAQALLKKPTILLLDEPCIFLDIYNQIKFMSILKTLSNMIVISAMHDINLSVRYADMLVLLEKRIIAFSGDPNCFDSNYLKNIYRIDAIPIKKDNINAFLIKDII